MIKRENELPHAKASRLGSNSLREEGGSKLVKGQKPLRRKRRGIEPAESKAKKKTTNVIFKGKVINELKLECKAKFF